MGHTEITLPYSMQKNYQQLTDDIKKFSKELGFSDIGFTRSNLSQYEPGFLNWLNQGFHGEMAYMAAHGLKRTRPTELEPGTQTLISVRYPYYDQDAHNPLQQLHQSDHAYISRYALGRDYHKLMRKKLQKLAEFIQQHLPDLKYRAFTDSAPVLERPIAEQAGLGFIGKNSLLIHPRAGSWFFLGELFINHALPIDPPFEKSGCGPCTACQVECPTQAIVADGVVDARRCISYLTIEYKGIIDESLRPLMGNRIYGCDDCQLVCPWNRFAELTPDSAFAPRHQLDRASLLELWQWTEAQFLKNLEGSPIRRIGYEQWQRNLAIAMGNNQNLSVIDAFIQALQTPPCPISSLVQEHIDWAIEQLQKKQFSTPKNAKIPRPALQKPVVTRNRTGDFDKKILNPLQTPKPFKVKRYYLPTNIKRRRPAPIKTP